MAYWLDTWRFSDSIEYEYKWQGKYGARGEKRQKKTKPTPEQVRKQNQLNREKTVRRLIKANFFPEDLWVTLKYPAGKRKPVWEVKKDFNNFIDSLRGKYKRRGHVFKFISRLEVGKRGGIHIHILIPRIRGSDTDLLVQKSWKHGRANFVSIYEEGGYEQLASYITKLPDEEVEKQLSFFPEEEQKEFVRYSCSRNLVRPQPERKVYQRWTLRKLVEEGPKPTPGFYIDKNSIHSGVNSFTGMTYMHYTEYKIGAEPWDGGDGGG